MNESLIDRGYVTWFDLTNMKGECSCCSLCCCFSLPFSLLFSVCVLSPSRARPGSTMDAMSDAIEGADVMLYGVSLRYKESANVRKHLASGTALFISLSLVCLSTAVVALADILSSSVSFCTLRLTVPIRG